MSDVRSQIARALPPGVDAGEVWIKLVSDAGETHWMLVPRAVADRVAEVIKEGMSVQRS